MGRFQYQKEPRHISAFLLSLCLFVFILLFFFQGISSFSADTRRRQQESLENALMRSITHCYTVEGAYPESLDYLKEHYGLFYDENQFFVDYRVTVPNILPDVTVMERRKK